MTSQENFCKSFHFKEKIEKHCLREVFLIKLNYLHLGYLLSTVVRHTSPTFYSITSPRDPRVHLPVTYFRFLSSTPQPFIWFSCFSYLCTKNMEFLTSSHSAVSNTLFIYTSFKGPLLFSQPTLPPTPTPNAP